MNLFAGFLALLALLGLSQQSNPVNTAPDVVITSPGSEMGVEYGTQVNFSANATDKEDGNLTGSISWVSSIDGVINSVVVLSEGEHIITAQVTDSGGLTASDAVVVMVQNTEPEPGNTPPTLTITSPSPNTSVTEGYSWLFKAVASDNEDGDLSNAVEWTSSIDGKIANLTTLSVGNHIITAKVADSDGIVVEDSISVLVTEEETVITAKVVEINWNTPLYRDDGTPLAIHDIGGYEITVGSTAQGEEIVIDVADGYATSLVTDPIQIQPGEYTLTIRTYDNEGVFSNPTAPLVVMVD